MLYAAFAFCFLGDKVITGVLYILPLIYVLKLLQSYVHEDILAVEIKVDENEIDDTIDGDYKFSQNFIFGKVRLFLFLFFIFIINSIIY